MAKSTRNYLKEVEAVKDRARQELADEAQAEGRKIFEEVGRRVVGSLTGGSSNGKSG